MSLLVAAAEVLAASPTPYVFSPMPVESALPIGQTTDIPIWPYLFQLLFVTGLLAGLSYLGLRFMREKMPNLPINLGLPPVGARRLKVVERVAVDAKRVVFIVSVGQREWLIAATEDHVAPIAELGTDDAGPDFATLVEKEQRP